MRTLIHNGTILTLNSEDRIIQRGDVLIEDSVIIAVGVDLDISEVHPDRVIDASQKLVMPGLINADLHPSEILLCGLFENLPLEIRPIYPGSDVYFHACETELINSISLLSGILALKSGVTTVQCHMCFTSEGVAENVSAAISAYQNLGIRATFAPEIIISNPLAKIPYLSQILPPSLLSTEERSISRLGKDQLVKIYEEIIGKWQNSNEGLLRFAIVPPESFLEDNFISSWIIDASNQNDLSLHFHLNQTKCAVISSKQRFQGKSPIEIIHQAGFLMPRTNVAHAVWVTSEEAELLIKNQVTIIHNPLSDLYLGSGVMPINLFLNNGAAIGLGIGFGTGGNNNIFDVLKMAFSLHRIAQPDFKKWPSIEQVLTMATRGGARSCLLEKEIGQVSAGFKADIVLYNLKGLSFSPLNNIKSQLICLETGSSVETVIVNGQVVVENGHITRVNENDVWERAIKLIREYSKILKDEVHHRAQLEPYLQYAYQRCTSEPMEIDCWANHPVSDSKLKQFPGEFRREAN